MDCGKKCPVLSWDYVWLDIQANFARGCIWKRGIRLPLNVWYLPSRIHSEPQIVRFLGKSFGHMLYLAIKRNLCSTDNHLVQVMASFYPCFIWLNFNHSTLFSSYDVDRNWMKSIDIRDSCCPLLKYCDPLFRWQQPRPRGYSPDMRRVTMNSQQLFEQ